MCQNSKYRENPQKTPQTTAMVLSTLGVLFSGRWVVNICCIRDIRIKMSNQRNSLQRVLSEMDWLDTTLYICSISWLRWNISVVISNTIQLRFMSIMIFYSWLFAYKSYVEIDSIQNSSSIEYYIIDCKWGRGDRG